MNRYVIGDIHGAHKALKQCLERAEFDYDNDVLIQLGDVADGWDEVYGCVEELLKIKELIALRGNHDEWFCEFLQSGIHPDGWRQGGYATAISYLRPIGKDNLIVDHGSHIECALNPEDVSPAHHKFFRQQHYWCKDEDGNIFVHGGFDDCYPIAHQRSLDLIWDRELWFLATLHKEGEKIGYVEPYNRIFIGHTFNGNKDFLPLYTGGVWNLDTGAGHGGKLTMMNIDTEEYFQSDLTKDLYPDQKGR